MRPSRFFSIHVAFLLLLCSVGCGVKGDPQPFFSEIPTPHLIKKNGDGVTGSTGTSGITGLTGASGPTGSAGNAVSTQKQEKKKK